ncbi:MAG: zf-TFIIB domain-containing protein [Candidatus Gastranaerophilales bacterium]|nr:zf-TFIIB domain-containing protein [Candidatus Gastranaerophilales bacterium]
MRDTKEVLHCPACNAEMKKVLISHKNVWVDVCVNGCHGIFLDNKELQFIDEKFEDMDDITEELTDKPSVVIADDSVERICPVCKAVMNRASASRKFGVKIDTCYSCGGVFLDGGELVKLRNEYESQAQQKEEFDKFMNLKYGNEIDDEINKVKNKTFRELLKWAIDGKEF